MKKKLILLLVFLVAVPLVMGCANTKIKPIVSNPVQNTINSADPLSDINTAIEEGNWSRACRLSRLMAKKDPNLLYDDGFMTNWAKAIIGLGRYHEKSRDGR